MKFRHLLQLVWVQMFLNLALPLAAETVSIIDPPKVWVAESSGARLLHPEDPSLDQNLLGTDGAQGVAIDPGAQQAWIHSTAGLSLRDSAGGLVQQWPLPSMPVSAEHVHLAPVPTDGSLWVAQGNALQAFGIGGQLLSQRSFDDAVEALELDTARQRLWVATSSKVVGLHALSAIELETIVPPGQPALTDIAIDPHSGELWIGHAQGLVRYSFDGQLLTGSLSHSGPTGVDQLAAMADAESLRGVWAVEGSELAFYDPALRQTFLLETFGPANPITSLAVDSSSGSAWVSDGRRIAEVRPGGQNSVLYDLGENASIIDLDVQRTVRLPEPPTLEILRPAENEVVTSSQPEIEIQWTEGDHEVVQESLQLAVSGTVLEVECEPKASGLVCLPVAGLSEGSTFLSASIADREQLRSKAAVVSFRVELEDEDPPSSETTNSTAANPTYTPIVSPRGLRPNTPFVAHSNIDHVDTASGNLTLDIPFGQTYEVGPELKYQIRAVYNMRAWEQHEVLCSLLPGGCEPHTDDKPLMFALTNPQSNAGLGWEVHFGRLYAPIPPAGLPSEDWFRWPNRDGASAQGLRWMYVAPDGAAHHLYPLPGRNNGTNQRPVRYAKDGSYLRMQQTSDTEVKVEFPNGLVSVFQKTSAAEGTNFCDGNAVTGCWRFSALEDYHGNRMWVTYAYSAAETKETWTVHDSTGRQHKLVFQRSNAARGGGDCATQGGNYCAEGNDEWGDPKRVLKRVKLASFGGAQATYELKTRVQRISRGCPHDPILPPGTETIQLPLLDRIEPPVGQPFKFEYHEPVGNSCNKLSGAMKEVTLPTGGGYGYSYTNAWEVPTRCSYHHAPDAEPSLNTTAISRRKVLNRDGTEHSNQSYSSQLLPAIPASEYSGPGCQRAKYRVTTVDAAKNGDGNRVRTKFYSAVFEGHKNPNPNKPYTRWQVTDVGLPYTKSKTTNSAAGGKLFLSQESFLCGTNSAGNPTSCAKKRSTYLRYTSEYIPCNKAVGDGGSCFKANAIPVRRKVRFHDDLIGGTPYFIETVNAQPDGVGHFRKATTIDDFDGTAGTTRQVFTTWTGTNATLGINNETGYLTGPTPSTYLPAPSSRWILGTFTEKKTWEPPSGLTYTTSYKFDTKGSLLCSRKQKNPNFRSSDDLVVEFQLGTLPGTNAGFPTKEIVAGGPGANLSTADACSGGGGTASNGTRYELRHTFDSSSLAKTEILGYPSWYRADIDPNTGLPSATYNPQDQKTTHNFDRLGRLTRSTPEASLNGAVLSIAYHNASANEAYVVEKQEKAGTRYSWQQTTYDGWGRMVGELRERPQGLSVGMSKRIQAFDTAGNLRKVSTWQSVNDFSNDRATFFRDFDIEGRAQRIEQPDGQEIRYAFFGDRIIRQIAEIYTGGGSNGFETVWNTTEKDAFGRTIRQKNLHNTYFAYDPYGQVTRSWRSEGGVTQNRWFTYDARGLLLAENHPEFAGTSTIYKRDAFGQVRQKTQGSRVLNYAYDTAGRLTRITEGANKIWKEWSWGTSNQGTNYSKGKVIQAKRHNYPFANSVDFPVVETYEYRGALGQLSQQKTWVDGLLGAPAPEFQQTLAYDPIGNVTSHTYPTCEGTICTGPDDQQAPAHTVTTSYRRGLPVQVTSSRGPWGKYSYHGNFQTAALAYKNQVTGTFEPGPNSMARPQRMSYAGTQGTHYDSGNFEFDELGNIYAIGEDIYRYDKASRLTYATVKRAGNRWEAYQFDAFDNITHAQQQNNGWLPFRLDATTNRYLGGNEGEGCQGSECDNIEYDTTGNMIKIGPPSFTMRYDAFDMQIHFHKHFDTTADYLYAYGPDDRRLVTFDTINNITTFQLRGPGGEILREFDITDIDTAASGGPVAKVHHKKDFVHGPDGLLATVTRSGETHYFHKDHLGTPRAVTNSAGVRVGKHDYYPFGQETPNNPQHDEKTVQFTGHQRDLHGFSDYMMGRSYLWPLRRFASVDPARDGWNLYTYTGNNPIKYVDPTGLERAQIILDQDVQMLIQGDLSEEEYFENIEARVAGGAAALTFFIPGPEDLVIGAFLAKSGIRALSQLGGRIGGAVKAALGKADDVPVPVRGTGADNAAKQLNLQKQLGSEQQVGELVSGGGQSMAGAGGRVPIRDIDRLVKQHGGSPEDFAKVRSSNFKATDGTSFETHGYRNIQTGEVVELKTKFQ